MRPVRLNQHKTVNQRRLRWVQVEGKIRDIRPNPKRDSPRNGAEHDFPTPFSFVQNRHQLIRCFIAFGLIGIGHISRCMIFNLRFEMRNARVQLTLFYFQFQPSPHVALDVLESLLELDFISISYGLSCVRNADGHDSHGKFQATFHVLPVDCSRRCPKSRNNPFSCLFIVRRCIGRSAQTESHEQREGKEDLFHGVDPKTKTPQLFSKVAAF